MTYEVVDNWVNEACDFETEDLCPLWQKKHTYVMRTVNF